MKIKTSPLKGYFYWLILFSVPLIFPERSFMAQIPVEWDRSFGGSGWENLESSFQTDDGGFILAGTSSSTNDGDISQVSYGSTDYWVVKTDFEGTIEWESRFGGTATDHLWSVIPRYEGGYILAGDSNSDQNGVKEEDSKGGKDFWVIMTDDNGNKIWDRTIGGTEDEELYNVIPTQDSCYILAGFSRSDAGADKSENSRGGIDFWLVKINRFGAIMWDRTIGGPGEDRLLSIKETADGGFILGGGSRSNAGGEKSANRFGTAGEADFWLVKIDANGNKLWDRTLGGDLEDVLIDIEVTSDNGFLLVGQTRSDVSGNKTTGFFGVWDSWVVKTDANGIKEWEQTFGGDQLDILTSVQENVIGNFVFGGVSDSPPSGNKASPNKGNYDFWMLYLSSTGEKLWDLSYGGIEAESLTEIHQIDNGSYYLIGHSRSPIGGDKQAPNIGLNDYWILKTVCDREIDLGADTLICLGETVSLDATDIDCVGCVYSWNDSGVSSPDRVLSPNETTLFEVYSVDSLGCAARDEIEIAIQAPPTVELGEDVVVCDGDTFELDAGDEGIVYTWTPSGDTQQLLVDSSDVYAVTVTDGLGCTTSDSIAVNFNTVIDTINYQETANNINTEFVISFELTGGDSASYAVVGIDGTITNNIFTSTPIPCNSTYQFSIQDDYTCELIELSGLNECPCTTDAGTMIMQSLKVCGEELAIAEHNGDHSLDDNDILIFVLHDQSDDSLGEILASNTSPSFAYIPDIVYGTSYYISAVAGADDGNGNVIPADECFSVTPGVPVVFYPDANALIIPLGDLTLNCDQISVVLDGSSSSSFADLNYDWSLNGNFLASIANPEVNEVGVYELQVTDQVSGCADATTVEITSVIDLPEVLIATPLELNCIRTTISLDGTASSSGTNFSYEWTGEIDAGAQSLSPEVSTPGMYYLSITNLDNNCSNMDSVMVEIDTLRPLITIGETLQLECSLPTVNLSASIAPNTGNLSYEWTGDNGQNIVEANTLTPLVSAAGDYLFTVTNLDNGCRTEARQTVLPMEVIDALELSSIAVSCYGDNDGQIAIDEVVGGTEPYLFSIQGQAFQDQNSFANLEHGTYTIRVQDINGCEVEETIMVESPEELQVDLGENQLIELGDFVDLNAITNQAIDTFFWETTGPIACEDCLYTYAEPTAPSTYKITVIDENGCSAYDILSVFLSKKYRVYIPTAFSPNNDGVNDFFTVYGAEEVAQINLMRVFGRWGESLFEARNILPGQENKAWDGYFKGQLLQPGIYTYFVEISYVDGTVELFKGDVTLMR